MVSLPIVTLNEEPDLSTCLAAVRWADDAVVLDICDRDRTPTTARAAKMCAGGA